MDNTKNKNTYKTASMVLISKPHVSNLEAPFSKEKLTIKDDTMLCRFRQIV
jgi:hypothetical protein